MKLDGYETYCLFIALKNHFTQNNYDFLKYHGKTKITKDHFTSHKDKYKYIKLSRKYDDAQMRDFIIANLLANRNWIGYLLEDESDDIYKSYIKRKQSISYIFDTEVNKLFSSCGGANKAFKIKKSEYPEILNLYFQNEISIETLSILNDLVQFTEKFDKKLGENDILWSKVRLLILKIKPFLEYDKDKIKNILKNSINNHAIIEEKELEKT